MVSEYSGSDFEFRTRVELGLPESVFEPEVVAKSIVIFVIKPIWTFKKARGLSSKLGPGFIRLVAHVVQAQH